MSINTPRHDHASSAAESHRQPLRPLTGLPAHLRDALSGIPMRPMTARALCLLAAAAILLVRKTDAFLNPQFWGEDALPFFIDAVYVGPEAFLRGYAGYFHLLPRLIAWAGNVVAFEHTPAFYVGAAAVVTLATVATTLSSRLALPWTPLLALAVVAVPHTGEVYLTPANLQWITAVALFATFLKADPANTRQWLVDALTLLVAGLSGPFVVLLLPFFVVRTLRRRTRASMLLLAVAAVPAALQIWVYSRSTLPPPLDAPVQWTQLAGVFSLHGVLSLFGAPWWSQPLSATPAIGLAVVTLGLFAWVSLVPRAKHLRAAVAMWLFAALLVVAAQKRIRFDYFGLHAFDASDRYFFLPKILLLWLLAISIDFQTLRGRVAATLLALSFVSNLPVFRFKPLPDLEWQRYCPALRAGEPVKVPINPDWSVDFPRRQPR